MRHITCVENIENLRALVKQDLRELGIKVPKLKKSKKQQGTSKISNVLCDQDKNVNKVFGNYLAHASCIHIADCGYVPRFLVDASNVILANVEQEGLFRKSGAVSRQKELKQEIEDGKDLVGTNVFDVTSLIKQYFRELPEPLFTSLYHDAFIKCFQLGDNEKAVTAVLLLSLLLPGEHLSTLRHVMKLLAEIARHAEKNKMDATNLAVVLAPNIMHINNKSEKMNASEEKLLQWQTSIVELLIHRADEVGMVSDSLYERTSLMTEAFGTDDDLDASEETLEESRGCKKKEKRRKRSGSFQGLVSSIAQSITKWRRSTDGKSGNVSQASNVSQVSNASHLSGKQNQSTVHTDVSHLPPTSQMSTAYTPVVMRKRKASGEIIPFSASKKKAILQNLPNQAALANTPFTPASGMRKLDINAMKKAGTLNTPSIAFSNSETPVAFSATPCQAEKNNSRKRINLFSPASARKGKKVVSSTNISIQSYGKKGKSKGLFRRLSGGKGEKLQEPPKSAQSPQVGQRLASPEGTINANTDHINTEKPETPNKNSQRKHSGSDESPIAAILQNSVFSPSNTERSILITEESVLSVCDDRNSLNEGFIVVDEDGDVSTINSDSSHIQNSDTTVRSCVSDPAINMSGNESQADISYRHSFCGEADVSNRGNQSLRRGQPNTLKAGLLQGEVKRVNKLRRSFGLDKSDISDPIPMVVPPLPHCLDTTNHTNKEKDSKHAESELSVPKLRSDVSISKINGTLLELENSDKNISASLKSEHLKVSSRLKNPEDGSTSKSSLVPSEGAYDSDESEAGFSTISGNTVIFVPKPDTSSGHLCPRTAIETITKSENFVEKSENKGSNFKQAKMQTSDSTDSLLSGQLEGSPTERRKCMSRTLSTDSGKGSMFDESGVVDNMDIGKHSPSSISEVMETENNVKTQSTVSEENNDESKMKKFVSSCDFKNTLSSVNVSRSQSMHNSSSVKKQPNFTPNLQISAETHKLLSRAGYLSTKTTATVEDDFVVMGPPILKIKQAETVKPKRESIIQLQTVHKGRVKHSIKQFNQGIVNKDSEIAERHMSPYRFANSVSRKTGTSSLKVPDILNSTAEEVKGMQDVVNINNKIGKGQAKVPISTHLLKPTDNVTESDSDKSESKDGCVRKNSVKRRPSIYYAKEKPENKTLDKSQLGPNVTLSDVQEESASDISNNKEIIVERSSEHEPMEVTELDQNQKHLDVVNKENGSEHCVEGMKESVQSDRRRSLMDEVHLNESLMETINDVCTPKFEKIAKFTEDKFIKSPLKEPNNNLGQESTPPPKLPPRVPIIKQPILATPLNERVCLRTAGGMTPRQVIRNSKSPRSPMKPVKRLKSPGSPHRNRCHTSPNHKKGTQLSSIPQHLQEEMDGM